MTAVAPPIVYVIDDDESFRRGIGRRLRASGMQTLEFESAEAFLAHRHADDPGCAIVDLHMPAMGGLALQARLAANHDALPLIFLTGGGDVRTSVLAMKGGAVDYLTKPVAGDELLAAVRAALRRDAAQRGAREHAKEMVARWESLSERQRQVARLVTRGLLNKQIAGELGTSERTVKAHRAEVMRRMGVQSLADLVRAVGAAHQLSGSGKNSSVSSS